MQKSQIAGAFMILVGLLVLALLASFVISVIWVILQLLAVIIGIILVLGGFALLLFGRRFGWRGAWRWEPPTST